MRVVSYETYFGFDFGLFDVGGAGSGSGGCSGSRSG
jgi:hypothetical protein